MKAQIIKTVFVEAARRVSAGDGTSHHVVGSSYRIDLIAEGAISDSIGWVVDYAELKLLFEPVRKKIDHHCLNDIPGMESDSTPQTLEYWINAQLEPWPEWFKGVRVYSLASDSFRLSKLPEEPESSLPERYAFDFSAAQALPQLAPGHPCRELHGHTYQMEIGGVNEDVLLPAARELHHVLNGSYLNEIDGLEQATAERIAAWVWTFLVRKGISPTIVGIRETPQNRCYFFGQ